MSLAMNSETGRPPSRSSHSGSHPDPGARLTGGASMVEKRVDDLTRATPPFNNGEKAEAEEPRKAAAKVKEV
jgi:hypothetical protein